MSSETPGSQAPASPPSHVVSARDVKQGLVSGDNPLDFIKKNLAAATPPEPVLDPNKVIAETEAQIAKDKEVTTEAESKEAAPTSTQYPIDLPTEVKNEEVTGEVSKEVVKDDSTQDNFKKLRTKAAEASRTVTELQAQLQTKEKELEDYRTGAVVPEIIRQKEDEIQKLTRYRDIVDLKMSPEYEEKVVKPIGNLTAEIQSIAKDYNVSEEDMEQVLRIGNRAERNRALSDLGFDSVGALELTQKLDSLRDLRKTAAEVEKEPVRALEGLKADYRAIQEQRAALRKQTIATTSRNSWISQLHRIRSEGKAKELIMVAGNTEHNENIVRPILTQAATEYGRLVSMLADAGLEVLPEKTADALATSVLLAHASAVSLYTREAAIEHANELEKNTQRTAGFTRPAIGTAGVESGGGRSTAAPDSPKEAATSLINSVLQKK